MFLKKAESLRSTNYSKKKIVILGLMAVFFLIGLAATVLSWVNRDPYSPNRVIRLHVIANSDSLADQALKYKVRDAIVRKMSPIFRRSGNIEEAREITEKALPQLQTVAEQTLAGYGSKHPVKVMHGRYNFPVKSYRNLIMPAGEYEAVRVVIGEGAGKNWWCVLFPPLCFVDVHQVATEKDVPEPVATMKKEASSNAAVLQEKNEHVKKEPEQVKSQDASPLDRDFNEYKDRARVEDFPQVKVRFKIYEIINDIWNRV